MAAILFDTSWCAACRKLIPQIEASEEIARLREDFVLIRCGDDCARDGDPAYGPDGRYVPRILLTDADGTVRREHYNFAARAETKYFYSTADELVETMRRALQHHREL